MRLFAFISITLLIVYGSMVGCNRPEPTPPIDPPVVNPVVKKVNTTLTGIVTDENGKLLSGATVTVGDRTITTSMDGLFLFENVEVPENRYFIKANMSNFFESGIGGIPVKDGVSTMQIKLMSIGVPQNIDAASGGIAEFKGAKINFEANSFRSINGDNYSGLVQLYARMLSPDDPDFSNLIPGGDLNSTMQDGSPATLESYGMIGVELRDISNNEIKLDSNKKAELRFPIATSQLSTAPDTIPLLYLDNQTGVWKQEGIARKQGNEYVGIVGHFSWWNCDFPWDMSTIRGRVVDCNDKPISGVTVVVNGQYTRITDENGFYQGTVPRTRLTFEVKIFGSKKELSSPVTLSNVQPGLNLVPDIKVGNCPTYVTGTINRCGSTNNFYIRAIWGQSMDEGSVPVKIQGDSFRLAVPQNKPLKIRISSGNFIKDTLIGSLNNGNVLDIGEIKVCTTPPSLKTLSVSNISETSATSGGELVSNGGGQITVRGVVWSTEPNPTISLSTKTNDGSGDDNFTSSITGLTKNTTYFVRAYATNSAGTGYGNELSFTTSSGSGGGCDDSNLPTFTDFRDGKVYKKVQIGTQEWMAENLNYKTDNSWCYENNASNCSVYGRLYDWQTAKTACPSGWHLPSDAEWKTLTNFLLGQNSNCFSGLPGGARDSDGFYDFGKYGWWWSSTEYEPDARFARSRYLIYSTGDIKEDYDIKSDGFSVRCVKD